MLADIIVLNDIHYMQVNNMKKSKIFPPTYLKIPLTISLTLWHGC